MRLCDERYDRAMPPDAARFAAFFALLSAALPPIEHRSAEAQMALFSKDAYSLWLGIDETDRVVALLAVWEFPAFRFIEHFAVCETLRGQGVGGQMLRRYLARDARPVVLEVERPDNETAARRIAFYRRAGFEVSDFPYMQLPLNPGDPPLPLLLMRSGGALGADEAAAVRDTLYREVYGRTGE